MFGIKPVNKYVVEVVVAALVPLPFKYILYCLTPDASVDVSQEILMELCVTEVATKPVGIVGGSMSDVTVVSVTGNVFTINPVDTAEVFGTVALSTADIVNV